MQRKSGFETVLVFALICLFGLLLLASLLTGAQAYQGVRGDLNEQYDERTCLTYIAAKVRRFDAAGAVALTSFGGGDALSLSEEIDGRQYVTLIYCIDGELRELYAERDSGLSPEDGLTVLYADELTLTWEGPSLIRAACRTAGGQAEIFLSPRCGVEAES